MPVVRASPSRFPAGFVAFLAIGGVIGTVVQFATGARGAGSSNPTRSSSLIADDRPRFDYVADASPLRTLVTKKLGGDAQVFGLRIDRNHALVHVAVTPALDAFDTLLVRNGTVQSRAPMVVPPAGAVGPQRVMRLSQIDLSRVASLGADAEARLAIPGGEVKTVTLSSYVFQHSDPDFERLVRDMKRSSDAWTRLPHWTFRVENERHASGDVSYALDGRHLATTHPP